MIDRVEELLGAPPPWFYLKRGLASTLNPAVGRKESPTDRLVGFILYILREAIKFNSPSLEEMSSVKAIILMAINTPDKL